ncbi:MAG: PAS domain S-box protein [Halothiobacillaceae bacterium]
MTVSAIARTDVLSCAPDTPICEAARRMRAHACGSILVVEEGRPVGIWTERDAARMDFTRPEQFEAPIRSRMSRPVRTVTTDTTLDDASLLLRRAGIRHLVVLDAQGDLHGVLSQTDLVQRYGVEPFLRLRPVAECLPPTCARLPDRTPVGEAAGQMAAEGLDAVVVTFEEGPPGIVTERDLLNQVAQRRAVQTLGQIASRPLRCLPVDSSLLDARRFLVDEQLRHLGIESAEGQLVGLLSMSDILNLIQRDYLASLTDALRERDEALIRSRQDLWLARQVIDSSVNAVMVVDESGLIESVNPAFVRITGRAPESVIGMLPDTVLANRVEDADRFATIPERMTSDGSWRGTIWFTHPGGEQRALAVTVHALAGAGPEGQGRRYAAAFHDATEEIRAAEERRIAAMAFDSVTPMMLTDTQARIERVNRAFEDMTGFSRGEVIGHTPAMLKSGRHDRTFYERMWSVLQAQGHWQGEVWNRRKNGEIYPEYLSISAVRDDEGQVHHYVGSLLDLTEHKQALQALHDERRLIDQSAIVLFEMQLGSGWPICHVSRNVTRTFGHDPVSIEHYAQPMAEWIHPDDRPAVDKAVAAMLAQGGDHCTQHFRFRDSGGEWCWVDAHLGLVRSLEGEAQGLTALVVDVTARHRADEALRVSEERYRLAQSASGVGIWDWDVQADRIVWDEYCAAMLGLPPDAAPMCYEAWRQRVHPEDLPGIESKLHAQMANGGNFVIEFRYCRADGGFLWVQSRGQVVAGDSCGDPARLIGTHTDITGRKRAEERQRLFASVFDSSHEAVMITDADNRIIQVNPAFTRISGYSEDEVMGRDPAMLSSGRQGPAFYATMWEALREKGSWRGEVWNRRKNGEAYVVLLSITTVHDDQGQLQYHVAVASDISQIKEHEAQLDRIAHYDSLTGLPNRRLLDDRLAQAVAHADQNGRQLAVCLMDLDGFKPVNDTHGHEVGDRLLMEIAGRLRAELRSTDTLARQGGDEFVLLLSDMGSFEQLNLLLGRVLEAVGQPLRLDDIEVRVTASIGVTLYPVDNADPDLLLRHADQAMYRAKEAGKNRFHHFDPIRDREVQLRQRYLQDVRAALAENQFLLHYQPKVNLDNGEVIGVEALIRWQHPEQGLIGPAAFLDAVAGSDAEMAIGEWVIDHALGAATRWHQAGFALSVSVNISANHLLQPGFADRLADLLDAHPTLAPEFLELEILESTALASLDNAAGVIGACRQLGVRFALDDFGTGYSSLSYLRSLPVDVLKIDQTFVRDMMDDPNDLSIVDGVVRLGAAFNRGVIAEGVETLDHAGMLLDLGCHHAQGYGIARPMPESALLDWIRDWRTRKPLATLTAVPGGPADLPLHVAARSYRQWLEQVDRYLRDPLRAPRPELDPRHCAFGRWHQGPGVARIGAGPEHARIEKMHRRVHMLAGDLVDAAEQSRSAMVQAREAEFEQARDMLLAALDSLAARSGQP